jgi:hypothetical protein
LRSRCLRKPRSERGAGPHGSASLRLRGRCFSSRFTRRMMPIEGLEERDPLPWTKSPVGISPPRQMTPGDQEFCLGAREFLPDTPESYPDTLETCSRTPKTSPSARMFSLGASEFSSDTSEICSRTPGMSPTARKLCPDVPGFHSGVPEIDSGPPERDATGVRGIRTRSPRNGGRLVNDPNERTGSLATLMFQTGRFGWAFVPTPIRQPLQQSHGSPPKTRPPTALVLGALAFAMALLVPASAQARPGSPFAATYTDPAVPLSEWAWRRNGPRRRGDAWAWALILCASAPRRAILLQPMCMALAGTIQPKNGSPKGLQGKEMAVPSRQRGPVGSIRDLTRRVRLEWSG